MKGLEDERRMIERIEEEGDRKKKTYVKEEEV